MINRATCATQRRSIRAVSRQSRPNSSTYQYVGINRRGARADGALSNVRRVSFSSVCVYCGSSVGGDPEYARAAGSLGRLIAERGMTLVYGGGHVGLMGVVADAALEAGGVVHGVITRTLEEHEVAHRGLTRLTVVETMHERKALMSDVAELFVMLPGGFGTLDEFFEAVTWSQLGIHSKPCGLLNVRGYFDPLTAFVERAIAERFIRPENRSLIVADTDAASLLDRLEATDVEATDKWLDRSDR
jgi:uncharacterized protein (TIGR00730 family)